MFLLCVVFHATLIIMLRVSFLRSSGTLLCVVWSPVVSTLSGQCVALSTYIVFLVYLVINGKGVYHLWQI